ncbi:MAG: CaiB/BaiF CoA-transferase family protein [Spirosomataceae bacterium]
MHTPTQGPLSGIRILDLTRLLPGPLGTMLMADMGADVIKIEHPEQPDYVRMFPPYLKGESAHYLAYNRSKRSLTLNYSTSEGQAVFFDLVKSADVVVEQFRPGFLDKIGIGYQAAKAHNPRIIYVSVTGYGQTGPYAHLAGHDLNYISYAGVLGVTGSADDAPVIPGVQLADIAGGSYMSVIATLAALQARTQTGLGQHVDVAMTDAVMPLLSVSYALYSAMNVSVPRGMLPLSGGAANYNVYRCADAKFIALGTLEAKFWNKFCDLVEKPSWKNFIIPNPIELPQQKAEVAQLFSTQPQAYWIALGTVHDLLISPVYEVSDLEHDTHLQARDMVIEVEHPTLGKIKQIGIPLKFSETPAQVAGPAPTMGQDTEAILRGLGYSDIQIKNFQQQQIVKGP